MTLQGNAEAAADLAVKKFFYILGVDVEDAKSVESFREDLRFNRKLRKLADHGIYSMVGLIALAITTALWIGIQNALRK